MQTVCVGKGRGEWLTLGKWVNFRTAKWSSISGKISEKN